MKLDNLTTFDQLDLPKLISIKDAFSDLVRLQYNCPVGNVESDKTWDEVATVLTEGIARRALAYRFDENEKPSENEMDAVIGLVQLVLGQQLTIFHTSMILSTLEQTDIVELLEWIRNKEAEATAE